MDNIQKMRRIGTKGRIVMDKFLVDVFIINFKKTWGRDRWLVKPVEGEGEAWVENVAFLEDLIEVSDEGANWAEGEVVGSNQ